MRRLGLLALFALAVASCRDGAMPVAPEMEASRAAAEGQEAGWIVVFGPGVENVLVLARELAAAHGSRPTFVYEHAIRGFAAPLGPGAAAALERLPQVAYVEPDRTHGVFGQAVPTGVRRIFADGNPNLAIDGGDDVRVDVDVAIIDTGIDFEHADLHVAGGVDCTVGFFLPACTAGGDDDHEHGTHVAGTVGALDNGIGVVGVAPGARLWAVKVLNASGLGLTSWILGGIDWVAANAGTIEVANMSLGGSGFSQSEYDAIQGAVDAGVAFAVAAGNSDADAAGFSPAGFDNVLTVSALADFDGMPGGLGSPTCRDDQDETLADFSNWGAAVQLAAPGVCIHSTVPVEKGGYAIYSGTSMASPHAAGALALLASAAAPSNATEVQDLYARVIGAGNGDWTDDSGDGVREPLLDVGDVAVFAPALVAGGDGGGTPTNSPPVAAFTAACDGLSCAFDGSGSTDADGTLAGYAWDFGDGTSGSGVAPGHTYAGSGVYTVTLTVTDDGGATDGASQSVAVTEPLPTVIALVASGYKVKGRQKADLVWAGATSAEVDVWRNGVKVATTANDGVHTDPIDQRGGGSYTYRICEAGTATCSNEATVTF